LGSTYTCLAYSPGLVHSSIWAIVWLENEDDITKLGCPVALPRLSSRPSLSTITEWPSANVHSCTCGLISVLVMPGTLARPAMSISLSKWPMFPTMAWCFILAMSPAMMMSLLPVVVTKMSAVSITSSSRTTCSPSIAACSAQIGSISVTTTRAPWPRSDSTQPLPTSP